MTGTEPLVWSLADTHCVWCGLPKASPEQWAVDHDGHSEFDEDVECWCMAVCWDTCRESVFTESAMADLRARVEAQAAVIAELVERQREHWEADL